MKRHMAIILAMLLALPLVAFAEEPIIEEADVETLKEDVEVMQVQPAKKERKAKATKKQAVEIEEIDEVEEIGEVKEVGSAENVDEVKIKMDMKVAPAFRKYPREKTFRAGLIGPGIYAGNKSIGAMMGVGAEGEYFFFENLSGGMRISVATDFKDDASPNAIVSFVPQARYVFDFDSHPRWSAYVQAGVGLSLIDGMHAAADIAIPGGGLWWQWDEKLSVGLDVSLHVLARGNTAFSVFAGPALRYQF